MVSWSSEATKALISIWGEQNVQEQLDDVSRNKSIYEKIAAAMRARGHQFDYKQCLTKVKNLTTKYRKCDYCDIFGFALYHPVLTRHMY